MRNQGHMCKACRIRAAVAKRECRTCYEYRRLYGRARPTVLDAPERLAELNRRRRERAEEREWFGVRAS